jgi:SNF2 family DNA or RNA helicase
MIKKSNKRLYVGIGYFLKSGFEEVEHNIIDITNIGATVKIIAGNLYINDKEGTPIINPSLDLATCELIVNLYENGKSKIIIRSVKKRFFHGKFFLGIGNDKAYLIGGSSNLSKNATTKERNIEYNFYTEDEINADIIESNLDWFNKMWDTYTVPLNGDDIEALKFLINKAKFNIDVEEEIHEGGQNKEKTQREIQTEIVYRLLYNMGFNPVSDKVDSTENPEDPMILSTLWLYDKYVERKEKDKSNKETLNDNNIDACIGYLEIKFRSKQKAINVLTDYIQKAELKEYYFDILKRILHRPKINMEKPNYQTFLKDVTTLFIIYYEQYHKKVYQRGSYGTGNTAERKSSLNLNKADKKDMEFKKPYKISNNSFQYLLKIVEKTKGNFSDDWMFQYQAYDSNTLIKMYDYHEKGAYVAHEAGMGKSAILCKFIKEAQARKDDVRTLIACPASLLYQWKNDNLMGDFGLSSEIVDNEKLDKYGKEIWTSRKINIVSIDFLKNVIEKGENSEEIKLMSPDILIIDEAHNIKNEEANRFKNISKLNPKFVILASATPLQNSVKEFLVQLNLIDDSINISRYKEMEYVLSLRDKYLIRKTRNKELAEIKSIKQAQRVVKREIITINPEFKAIYDELEERLKLGELYYYKFLGEIKGQGNKYRNIGAIASFIFLQQLTSSVSAFVQGFKKLSNKIGLIINNDLEALSKEEISEFETSEERDILNTLYEYKDNITTEKIEKLEKDLELINEFINDDTGKLMKDKLLIKNTKEEKLLEIFSKEEFKNEQCLIFVKYIATGMSIQKILQDKGYTTDFFTGSMSKKQRDDAVQRFKSGEKQILIATDSANAGLNLQTANFMINFDLNWNPQIVEQRIGRIHRIGQKSAEVLVLNLFLSDTVDTRIEELMTNKINTFTGLFITSDEIIGAITKIYMEEKEFVLNTYSAEELIAAAKSNEYDIEDRKNAEILLQENESEINKINNEYVFNIEALRLMLIWILDKYNIDYYTKDDMEYYLKLDNNEVYIMDLSQVYNMIDNEHEFFKDFSITTPITNKKYEEGKSKLESIYFSKEDINVKEALIKINSLELSDDLKESFKQFINERLDNEIVLFNLDLDYTMRNGVEEFKQKDFKSVIIDGNNKVYSDEEVIKLLSIVSSIEKESMRIESFVNGDKYKFLYNIILNEFLLEAKKQELKEFNVDIKHIVKKIYNGSIIKFTK